PQPPEQVRVLPFAGLQQLPLRGHQLKSGDVVARQPEAPRQPPHPAAEGEPTHPVWDTFPAVVANPYAWAARSRSPSSAPPATQARRRTGSTRTEFIGVRSSIRPPSGTDSPRTLWPPQRTPSS